MAVHVWATEAPLRSVGKTLGLLVCPGDHVFELLRFDPLSIDLQKVSCDHNRSRLSFDGFHRLFHFKQPLQRNYSIAEG